MAGSTTYATNQIATPTEAIVMPEHLREMWAEDDAEVNRLLALKSTGNLSAEELPAFQLWTRGEMLEQIGRLIDIEARHLEMSRENLVEYMRISTTVLRASRIPEELFNVHADGYFSWVRETYTSQTVDIYEELNAPKWLVNRLRAEIT